MDKNKLKKAIYFSGCLLCLTSIFYGCGSKNKEPDIATTESPSTVIHVPDEEVAASTQEEVNENEVSEDGVHYAFCSFSENDSTKDYGLLYGMEDGINNVYYTDNPDLANKIWEEKDTYSMKVQTEDVTDEACYEKVMNDNENLKNDSTIKNSDGTTEINRSFTLLKITSVAVFEKESNELITEGITAPEQFPQQ